MVAGTAEKALETPPEGNVRKPLSGAVSGQPDKILHGGPAQAERHGSLHGIHRAYRRQSHKGGKRARFRTTCCWPWKEYRERMLPTREGLREERPGNIWKLISGYGEITGGKPVPLRRAVYLRAHGREIDRTALKRWGFSPGCRNYEAYETAMERASEGEESPEFRLTLE